MRRVTGSVEEREYLARKAGLDEAHIARIVDEEVPLEELVLIRDLWRELFRAGIHAAVDGRPIGLQAIDRSRKLGELLASMFERHQVEIEDPQLVATLRWRLEIDNLSDQLSEPADAQK